MGYQSVRPTSLAGNVIRPVDVGLQDLTAAGFLRTGSGHLPW